MIFYNYLRYTNIMGGNINRCDQLYMYNYSRQYRTNKANRIYYQNYASDYNQKNKDKLNIYNNKRYVYKKLMKTPGCIIEHIEGPVKIVWE
jgi:hypothetical protein